MSHQYTVKLTNIKCEKSAEFSCIYLLFWSFYTAACEIILLCVCIDTMTKIQWSKGRCMKEKKSFNVSTWIKRDDRDCISVSRWAALRIKSSVTAIDPNPCRHVQLISGRYRQFIGSARLCCQTNPYVVAELCLPVIETCDYSYLSCIKALNLLLFSITLVLLFFFGW